MGQYEGAHDERGRRLVLGFDAGCVRCSELARKIEERVGDELEIQGVRCAGQCIG